MNGCFESKNVIVTGAASGIGYVTALAFATHGAYVVGVDMNRNGLRRWASDMDSRGGHGSYIECDISREQNVQQMISAVANQCPHIDVLVHMAAQFIISSVASASGEEWSRALNNNLTGAALCGRFAAAEMSKNGGGAIVLTASIAGMRAEKGFATYACGKAGLLMLAQSMAVEFGPANIRVNAVSPGPVDSPVLRRITANAKTDWDKWSTALRNRQCLQERMVRPEDVAEAVLFLAGDRARMITGTNLVVDGGYSVR